MTTTSASAGAGQRIPKIPISVVEPYVPLDPLGVDKPKYARGRRRRRTAVERTDTDLVRRVPAPPVLPTRIRRISDD